MLHARVFGPKKQTLPPRSKSVILQLLKPTDQFSGQKALQGAVAQSLSLSTGHLKARQPSPEWMVLPLIRAKSETHTSYKLIEAVMY